MALAPPTRERLREAAAELGLDATDADRYAEVVSGYAVAYAAIDALEDEHPRHVAERRDVHAPTPEENPYGAWVVRTSVRGSGGGKLAGRPVALKDNICLAGVPMAGGASFLEGYVPDVDATVVTRILDAGGEIVGKAACEYLSCSGGSHTSASGPVENPLRPGTTTGGSSSGCGALLAAGEVDFAVGGDQGGSIRIPSAFCGTVGLKPTFGLVPYTGILSIEPTIDHTGPMTRTVEDNALLLEVLAGPDGIDTRQPDRPAQAYTEALGRDLEGVRIGVLEEGFGHPNSQPGVDAQNRAAAEQLAKLGASIERVSIPAHLEWGVALFPIMATGGAEVILGDGVPSNNAGLTPSGLVEAFSTWRERADELPDLVKVMLLIDRALTREERRRTYAKAQNVRRRLRDAYDRVLSQFDLLAMPTLPITAQPIPAADAPLGERLQRSTEMMGNTAQFDVTGHPAISVPCGEDEGLPVGLMLVGRHFDEPTVYRAAHAYERSRGAG